MCGINGLVHYRDRADGYRDLLAAMNKAVVRRGPDDGGFFTHENVGFAHRRLSIIDLSENARQPICNETQTVWLTFNGEIYNYRELAAELTAAGHRFGSQTDSEVIVHAYEQWGIDFVARLDGMFAFGLYDQHAGRLVLAKDRFGKKPLYYTLQNGCLLFSSSLKAMQFAPMVDWRLDIRSLHKYLAYEYVPTPRSIIEDVHKLPAAHYFVLSTREQPQELPKPVRYWSMQFQPKSVLDEDEACERFLNLFDQAVQKRLMSDVPLGVFLSGGVDSSCVAASMCRQMPRKNVKTFSIGFQERTYDESPDARLVAQYFGTDHHEMIVSPGDAQAALPEIMALIDEPFADGSMIPTYLLSKFTRQTVTVALDGAGADEMLAGYDTFMAQRCAGAARLLPAWTRKALARAAELLPVSTEYMSFDFRVKRFLGGLAGPAAHNPALLDLLWMSAFSPETLAEICPDGGNDFAAAALFSEALAPAGKGAVDKGIDTIVRHYLHLYHQDDIQVKVDRASMMHSLEVRCPFLDTELATFVNRLPTNYKMKRLQRKYILKKAMRGILPDSVLTKKKQGFAMPVGDWLKEGLRPLMDDLLAPDRLQRQGLFNAVPVGRLVQDHLAGRQNNRKPLWTLLMFQMWLEENKPTIH